VLAGAGATLADVVKVSIHLQNINDFARMNAVYEKFFPEPRPARTTVQSVLTAGISIEIDAIAIRGCSETKHD
jgi:2-iminobutanoate/2-iminopropanoate deaminase